MKSATAADPHFVAADHGQFIEHNGPTEEEVKSAFRWRYEFVLQEDMNMTELYGVALVVFLAHVIYHTISKLRGNEKNDSMNNFGIGLALIGLVNCIVGFADLMIWFLKGKVWVRKWLGKHEIAYLTIWWCADSLQFLFHWIFSWRYIKSTAKLPLLQKCAEFHSYILEKIFMQREDQDI